ncbi:MAG: glycoside hydrolase family 25 protein [Sulfobacillus thermotolerans]|nr:glycoside hydrolase family 25 protein [Sulfobacillus thermotolerans]
MAWSCGSSSNIKGVDVSSAQGNQPTTTDWWQTIRSENGVQFGIIKATEGISYINPYVQASWSACNKVNGAGGTGLYHFLDWQYGGADQAKHFWSVVSSLTSPTYNIKDSILAVDIEEPNGTSSTGTPSMTVVNDFINELTNKLGGFQENLVIYTNEDTWVNLLGNPDTWSYLALWLGAMDGESYCPPYTFGGWVNWSYMQYGSADLDGVTTDLDQLGV